MVRCGEVQGVEHARLEGARAAHGVDAVHAAEGAEGGGHVEARGLLGQRLCLARGVQVGDEDGAEHGVPASGLGRRASVLGGPLEGWRVASKGLGSLHRRRG